MTPERAKPTVGALAHVERMPNPGPRWMCGPTTHYKNPPAPFYGVKYVPTDDGLVDKFAGFFASLKEARECVSSHRPRPIMSEPRCPQCAYCPCPSGRGDHEAWWWAMCARWSQCPNDSDAFWNMDRAMFLREQKAAKEDPAAYERGLA